jgi:hypothetical protein
VFVKPVPLKAQVNISPVRPTVAEEDAADAADVPALFVAVTVKVYAEPFVRPVTVAEVVEDVAVAPPGLAVTV